MAERPEVVYVGETELGEPDRRTADTAADDPAFILYTSGTTKDPKGVVHTHRYTWAKRAQAERWLDAKAGDLVWCTAGTGWAKSIWNVLLGPWSCGSAVVLHEGGFDPEERCRLIGELGVDRPLPGADRVPADGEARRSRASTTSRGCGTWSRPASR